RFGEPPSRAHLVGGARPNRILHPYPQGRLVHDPGVDALEPVVPPAQALLEEANGWPGWDRLVGIVVRPGHDQALAGCIQMLKTPEDRVAVPVCPAADGVDGAPDRRIVLAHRPVLPVAVASLMGEPMLDHRPGAAKALMPALAPGVAGDSRIWRQRRIDTHRGRPRKHVVSEDAAAHAVPVLSEPVVAGGYGDDRRELRRPQGGRLKGGESPPRVAEHPDPFRAPWLARDPRDDVECVLLLLREVLVRQDPLRIPRAPDVQPHRGVAVLGEIAMPGGITGSGDVALTVRGGFQQRRGRPIVRILGKPDPGREPNAVPGRDPDVFDALGSRGNGNSRRGRERGSPALSRLPRHPGMLANP